MSLANFLSDLLGQGSLRLGQLVITPDFTINHQDDLGVADLTIWRDPNEALEIARYDDAGKYRPLKTAANLRHGWKLVLKDASETLLALDFLYPASIGTLSHWQSHQLCPTPVRETLSRQTGMYAVVKKISEAQIHEVKSSLCGGTPPCLRRVLWTIDPPQSRAVVQELKASSAPLLCAEICNLFVAEGRKVVKKATGSSGLVEQ